MVSVPVRAAPALAATEKLAVPSPVPVAPDVKAIKLELLAAVQPQPEVVLTLTVPAPPLAGKLWLVDEREKLQA